MLNLYWEGWCIVAFTESEYKLRERLIGLVRVQGCLLFTEYTIYILQGELLCTILITPNSDANLRVPWHYYMILLLFCKLVFVYFAMNTGIGMYSIQ